MADSEGRHWSGGESETRMNDKIRFIDLFAGVGGFHLGLTRASKRFECVYSNEWDKYANSVYRKHFGECDSRDIKLVRAEELPEFDLLCGGFPCQSFSMAGKRRGFEDTRGTMFFEIARIVREKKPRLLLLENVKGLLNHDNGATFEVIVSTLQELGYSVEWQVLNSKNHGVPQNRERVFIIGHLGNECRRAVFPIGSNKESFDVLQGPTTNTIGANEGRINKVIDVGFQKSVYGTDGICPVVREGHNDVVRIIHPKISVVGNIESSNECAGRVYSPEGLPPTVPTACGGHIPKIALNSAIGICSSLSVSGVGGIGSATGLYAIPVLTPDRAEKRQRGRRFKEDGEPAFTVTGQDRHGVFTGQRIRRLTPVECERLQGFPDYFTKEGLINGSTVIISDSQRYKMMGNAVTVNVITAIGKRLAETQLVN
jgi:DNA (cytosine-5)-methyltransferase 1